VATSPLGSDKLAQWWKQHTGEGIKYAKDKWRAAEHKKPDDAAPKVDDFCGYTHGYEFRLADTWYSLTVGDILNPYFGEYVSAVLNKCGFTFVPHQTDVWFDDGSAEQIAASSAQCTDPAKYRTTFGAILHVYETDWTN
jgi:hypothetical protein